MAVISKTITYLDRFHDDVHVILWETVANGDTGDPLEMPGSADRSVQVTGTFGSGGTIVLEGSNDGTNYVTLTDPQGNAISFTAAGIEAVSELTRWIRPNCTAGDGTTDLDVTLLVKRSVA